LASENYSHWAIVWRCIVIIGLAVFAYDRQTDRQTDRRTYV